MTAVFCANAADRKAETWEKQLAPFDRLEFAVSDAAKGIAKAVAELARARRDDPDGPGPGARPGRLPHHDGGPTRPGPALAACRGGLGGGGGRRRRGRPAETARASTPGAWPGPPAPPGAGRSRRSSRPSVWKRPGAGPTPRWTCSGADGRLNDRAHAEAEIAAALKGLTGPDWSKVRNFLTDRAEPELPGPDAPAAGVGRAAARVARGDGLALVAAAPPAAGRRTR